MLDLQDARANVLGDDEASWPATGNLLLNGFEYSSFGAESPAGAESRLRLAGAPARTAIGRNPTPQLAKVFVTSGRERGSDHGRDRAARRPAARRRAAWASRAWNAMLQATIGYGFLPLRALWWIAGFVAFGTVLFHWGYMERVITPTEEGGLRIVHAKRNHSAPLSALQRVRVFIGKLSAAWWISIRASTGAQIHLVGAGDTCRRRRRPSICRRLPALVSVDAHPVRMDTDAAARSRTVGADPRRIVTLIRVPGRFV